MTPEQIDQERAAFEAWWCETIGVKERLRERFIKSSSPCLEMFKNTAEGMIWEAWLARAEQGGWIKNAKDSRPKYYGRNIVSTKLGNVFVGDYDKHFCRWEIGGKIIDGVTHWQPLPNLPAGDPA